MSLITVIYRFTIKKQLRERGRGTTDEGRGVDGGGGRRIAVVKVYHI